MNLPTVKFRGGARIGTVRASSPSTILVASKELLSLQVPLLQKYQFHAYQVISLTQESEHAMRINHIQEDYPEEILFVTETSQQVIEGILLVGFLPSASKCKLPCKQENPLRWETVTFLILLWNCLLLAGVKYPSLNSLIPLPVATLGLFAAGCIIIRYSSPSQKMLLKPGRRLKEISPALNLVTFIATFFCVLMLLSEGLNSHSENPCEDISYRSKPLQQWLCKIVQ